MRFTRGAAAIAAAISMLAGAQSAQAQISYWTSGFFTPSGPGFTCVPDNTSCTTSSFTLSFAGVPIGGTNNTNIASGSQGPLGNFGLALTQPVTTLTDGQLAFTLVIHQTVPLTVSPDGQTSSSVTGRVGVGTDNLNNNTLVWFPDPIITIGPVSYAFKNLNADGSMSITDQGSLQAIIATPEPASMTLLATGLVGIFGAARRRKSRAA